MGLFDFFNKKTRSPDQRSQSNPPPTSSNWLLLGLQMSVLEEMGRFEQIWDGKVQKGTMILIETVRVLIYR